MYSKEQICNRALRILKIPLISSLDEDTKEAEHCRFLYPIIKKEVLGMYCWKNALKTIQIKFLYNEDAKLNYKYKFLLPLDLLRIIEVNGDTNYCKDSRYIYSNNEEIQIRYIADLKEEDLGLDLARLVSFKLALELSYAYADSLSFVSFVKNLFQEEYLKLSSVDAKNGSSVFSREESSLDWIKSRH